MRPAPIHSLTLHASAISAPKNSISRWKIGMPTETRILFSLFSGVRLKALPTRRYADFWTDFYTKGKALG